MLHKKYRSQCRFHIGFDTAENEPYKVCHMGFTPSYYNVWCLFSQPRGRQVSADCEQCSSATGCIRRQFCSVFLALCSVVLRVGNSSECRLLQLESRHSGVYRSRRKRRNPSGVSFSKATTSRSWWTREARRWVGLERSKFERFLPFFFRASDEWSYQKLEKVGYFSG